MTEQEARDKAEALAFSMGITFYVVRNAQGEIQTVQLPPDGCDVIASIPPPDSVHDQGLARNDDPEPSLGARGLE